MLDLKELERKLDEALERETKESMLAWLQNQRCYLAETGKTVTLMPLNIMIEGAVPTINISEEVPGESNYAMAA